MFTYLLQASICWVVFYLLYYMLFRNNTFFTLNRLYLVFSLLIGLLLPLCPVQEHFSYQDIIVEQSYDMPVILISSAAEVIQQTEQIAPTGSNKDMLLYGIYGLGILVLGFRYFYGIWQIFSLYRNGKKIKKRNYTLVHTKSNHPPFSFFRFLFCYQDSVYEPADENRIRRHEEAHIYGLHSFDIQFIELLKIIFWPSVVLLFYSRSLKTVHEYLADAAVLKNEVKKRQYGQLLIRQLQSGPLLAAAHYFTHSQLKKRLIMMTKTKTNRQHLYMYLLVVPLLSMFTLAFSLPSNESAGAMISSFEQEVDQLPIFNGCEQEATLEDKQKCSKEKLMAFMIEHLKYPEAAKVAGAEGMVVVKFTIDKDGMVSDAEVVKHGSYGMDEAALAVVNKMPQWAPAQKDGKAVATELSLPFAFKLPIEGQVYEEVDEMPRFPGCEEETTPQALKNCAQKALFSYIFSNLKYPEEAKEQGLEGVVVASFVVTTEGKLKDISIARSVHKSLDNTVLKIIESMNHMEENWVPGQKDGQKVNVSMKLPIKFKLEGDEDTPDNKSAELQLQDYQLTPNHSQNSVFLSFKSDSNEPLTIQFSDIQGRIISRYNGDYISGGFEKHFTFDSTTKGALILQIQQGKKIFTEKIVML